MSNPKITFEAAAEIYLQRLEESGGKNLRQKAQQLRDHLIPAFGDQRLLNLRSHELNVYRKTRVKKGGVKPATVNRELAVVSQMVNLLAEWGIVDATHIKISRHKEDNRRDVIFSDSQIREVLEKAQFDKDPYIHLFCRIGFFTAMRHSEILKLRFEDFDHEHLTVEIREAKAGRRQGYMTKDVSAAVQAEAVRRGVTTGYVFASDGKYGRRMSMKTQFARIMRQVGLDSSEFVPHVMRHTAITKYAQSGSSLADLQKFSGHKSMSMLLRYTHATNDSVRKGMEVLEFNFPMEALDTMVAANALSSPRAEIAEPA